MYYVLGSSEKKIIRLMSKSLKKSFASLIKFAFAVAFWIASKKDKSDKLMQMALSKEIHKKEILFHINNMVLGNRQGDVGLI